MTYFIDIRTDSEGRFTFHDPFFHALHGNLQSCAIQAGNLYMFVMHNPVRWLDPLGLFAWNEDDDHWFDIGREVRDAGGSFSRPGNTAWISVFGVDVSFRVGDDGVRVSAGGRMMVRADTFYSAIVNAATEIIFLGGHNAFDILPAYHLHVSMFVSRDSAFHANAYFTERWSGVWHATLSGTGVLGLSRNLYGIYAVSQVNSSDYFNRNNLRFINHLHTGVGMVEQLFNAHDHFTTYHSRRFGYGPAGVTINRVNSTSITIGLLNAVGLDHGLTPAQQRRAVGIQSTVPPIFWMQVK